MKISQKVSFYNLSASNIIQSWKAAHLSTLEIRVEQGGIVPVESDFSIFTDFAHWLYNDPRFSQACPSGVHSTQKCSSTFMQMRRVFRPLDR